MMEEKWYQARACLRHLHRQHPDWGPTQLTQAVGYSYSWVRKWCQRFDEAAPDEFEVLHSQSRCRKTPPPGVEPAVVAKILAIRDDPPLYRTPGPKAIKYYLHNDEEFKKEGHTLPRSTSTIWKVLDQNGRIERPEKQEHEPVPRAAPMKNWQIDFKDVTTVPVEPGGKQMHLVETLNVIDTGTSILLDNQARTDFNAETALDSLAHTLQWHGCPAQITFDRDPRFVGSWSAGDFPSPLMRFLLCLGIEVEVCPPRRPDKNAFVERYHLTYDREGIRIFQPETLEQVVDMNLDFRHHYNFERPNQALTCGNQPPRLAFEHLPTLPSLPESVDPDSWLDTIHGKVYKRRVDAAGTVKMDKQRYYIRRDLRGRYVLLQIDAPNRQIQVLVDGEIIKTMPIKGLYEQPLSLADYLKVIKVEAVSQWRRYLNSTRRYVRLVA
jgi:hypothetical protein